MINPHYLKVRKSPEGEIVASTVRITDAGQTGCLGIDIDRTGRILGVERIDGAVDVAALKRVLQWAVSPTVSSAARRWHLPAGDATTDAERDAAAAAEIILAGRIPKSNTAGGGWEWTDRTGATLRVGGRYGLAADDDMDLSAAQWAELALVAEAMAGQLAAAQSAGVADVGADVRVIG